MLKSNQQTSFEQADE